jgi:hypothetical protein
MKSNLTVFSNLSRSPGFAKTFILLPLVLKLQLKISTKPWDILQEPSCLAIPKDQLLAEVLVRTACTHRDEITPIWSSPFVTKSQCIHCWKFLKIFGNFWKLLEIFGNCWKSSTCAKNFLKKWVEGLHTQVLHYFSGTGQTSVCAVDQS